jgi:hypothetical protein
MAAGISSLKIKEHKCLKPVFIYTFGYEKSQQVYKKRFKFWAIYHAANRQLNKSLSFDIRTFGQLRKI